MEARTRGGGGVFPKPPPSPHLHFQGLISLSLPDPEQERGFHPSSPATPQTPHPTHTPPPRGHLALVLEGDRPGRPHLPVSCRGETEEILEGATLRYQAASQGQEQGQDCGPESQDRDTREQAKMGSLYGCGPRSQGGILIGR